MVKGNEVRSGTKTNAHHGQLWPAQTLINRLPVTTNNITM